MQDINAGSTTLLDPHEHAQGTADAAGTQFYKQAFGGAWMTQAISVAAELGIADLLEEGPRTIGELARATGTRPEPLYRLLRALASVGVFDEKADQHFALTPRGELLRTHAPDSQRAFATLMGREIHEAWAELAYSVRTGKPGFEKRMGAPVFQYLVQNPDRHAIFDAGMTSIHDEETEPVIDAYNWNGVGRVVDVGGGNGRALAALLRRQPHIQGTVYELPQVGDRARAALAEVGLSHRCEVVGGDFFQAVPAGGDVYMLRHIVHDWDDDAATTILRNCRKALAPGARVLVVESVIPPANEPHFGKWLDLMMLLIGGRERTAEQYSALFAAAGLCLRRIIATNSDVSIVEGIAAD